MSVREQEILAAAERLFFERSFDGVGVDEIGRAAGLSGSAIYRHFPGKDAILAALFDKVIDAILVRMGTPHADPEIDLQHVLRVHLELSTRHERLASIWLREQRSLAARYRQEHDHRQALVTDRLVASLERRYPGRTRNELVTVARGLQLLLFSEALRPPGGRRAEDAGEMLLAMAVQSLSVLDSPVLPRR